MISNKHNNDDTKPTNSKKRFFSLNANFIFTLEVLDSKISVIVRHYACEQKKYYNSSFVHVKKKEIS